jgi:hypothetical protein
VSPQSACDQFIEDDVTPEETLEMKSNDPIQKLLLAAVEEWKPWYRRGAYTRSALTTLADYLQDMGHIRHVDVRELVNCSFHVPPLSPDGEPRPVACGSWWHAVLRAQQNRSLELWWIIYPGTRQAGLVNEVLGLTEMEFGLRPEEDEDPDLYQLFECLRLRLIAAVLGRNLDDVLYCAAYPD